MKNRKRKNNHKLCFVDYTKAPGMVIHDKLCDDMFKSSTVESGIETPNYLNL